MGAETGWLSVRAAKHRVTREARAATRAPAGSCG
jgi:hypothetical protein